MSVCSVCGGSGRVPCGKCKGTGVSDDPVGFGIDFLTGFSSGVSDCPDCGGDRDLECAQRDGSGEE